MNSVSFFPLVDIPLIVITVAAYLWHINRWAYRTDIETSLDLPSGLPKARRRIVFLFVGLGVLCWLLDFAVWSLYACILLIDLLLAAISNGGGPAGLFFIVYIVREWAFGFPQIILHPPRPTPLEMAKGNLERPLIGKIGVTKTMLRPSGIAIIDGKEQSVVSATGELLKAETHVKVTGYQNGYPAVTFHFEFEQVGD